MLAIGERFDRLEQKIDFTREILEEKINGLRTELNSSINNVGLKLDHLASTFEVMVDLAEIRLRLDRLERKP